MTNFKVGDIIESKNQQKRYAEIQGLYSFQDNQIGYWVRTFDGATWALLYKWSDNWKIAKGVKTPWKRQTDN